MSRPGDGADPVTVIRLDLRAGASGPHAVEADEIGPDTLTGVQQQAVRRLPAPPADGGRRRRLYRIWGVTGIPVPGVRRGEGRRCSITMRRLIDR